MLGLGFRLVELRVVGFWASSVIFPEADILGSSGLLFETEAPGHGLQAEPEAWARLRALPWPFVRIL